MYLMGVDEPGWMRSDAQDLRAGLLTVLLILWELKTALTVKMLECGVLGLSSPLALKGPLDYKGALPLRDVWKSATAMSGAQCVMICGELRMHKLSAGSWDYHLVVSIRDVQGQI